MAAVIKRQATGEGQSIDISMSDAALALTTMSGASAVTCDEVPGYATEMLNGGTFYDYYKTSDGRYLSVGGLEPKFFMAFFEALGHPEWSKRMADQSLEGQGALKKDIQALIEKNDFAHWSALFGEIDACVEPVLNMAEVKQHPHFIERDMFVDVPCVNGQVLRQIANPVKFSKSKARYDFAGAALGQHTEEVLANYDITDEQLQALRSEGVIL